MTKILQLAGIGTTLALLLGILGCVDDSSRLYATWDLVALSDSGKPIDVSKAEQGATITIEKGKFNGNAGCNGVFGVFLAKGRQLEFGNVGATRKLCAPESMAVEDTLMKLFTDTAVAFDLQGDRLVLQQGAIRAEFRAQDLASTSQPLEPHLTSRSESRPESKEANSLAESKQAQLPQADQKRALAEQVQ